MSRPQISAVGGGAYVMWLGGLMAGVGASTDALIFAGGVAISLCGVVLVRTAERGK